MLIIRIVAFNSSQFLLKICPHMSRSDQGSMVAYTQLKAESRLRTDLWFVFSFSGEQREGEREAAGARTVSRQVRKVRTLSPGGKLR